MIEKVSGKPYEEFVQEQVLSRCGVSGMKIAGNTRSEKAPNEVTYYGSDRNGDDPYSLNVKRADAAGGWIATASDLVRLALDVDGFSYVPNILEKQTIEVMTTVCEVSASPRYAKGWYVNAAPDWWHSGGLPGASAVLYRTSTGLCWAALANTGEAAVLHGKNMDAMMWDMAAVVPEWHASLSGSSRFSPHIM